MEPAQSSQKKPRFLKSSEHYKELSSLIEDNGWNVTAKLPRQHSALTAFLQRTGYTRSQVKRKFDDFIADKAILPEPDDFAEVVGVEENEVPSTESLLSTLSATPEIKAILNGLCCSKDYLERVLKLMTLWEKLRVQVIVNLQTRLKAIKKVTQMKVQSRIYSEWKRNYPVELAREFVFSLPDNASDPVVFSKLDRTDFIVGWIVFCAPRFIRLIERSILKNTNIDWETTIQDAVNSSTGGSVFQEGEVTRQKLYYISGWMLCAAQSYSQRTSGLRSLRPILENLVDYCSTRSFAERISSNLPFQYVKKVERYGHLKYPTREFYRLITVFELVAKFVLKSENFLAIGPEIISVVSSQLQAHASVHALVCECIDPDCHFNAANISELLQFLLRTYFNMRGKDFVRRLMCATKRSLSTQHRHEMSVVSNPQLRKKLTYEVKDEMEDNILYFDDSEENLEVVRQVTEAAMNNIVDKECEEDENEYDIEESDTSDIEYEILESQVS